MTKPEDDLPRFYIEAAQAVVLMHPFPSENETGKAIEAVRRAILSAVEEEREACAAAAFIPLREYVDDLTLGAEHPEAVTFRIVKDVQSTILKRRT